VVLGEKNGSAVKELSTCFPEKGKHDRQFCHAAFGLAVVCRDNFFGQGGVSFSRERNI
jgi:hypothetical protein